MLADLYDIGDASVVGTLALENFEVVMVVDLARCMKSVILWCGYAKDGTPSQERCTV